MQPDRLWVTHDGCHALVRHFPIAMAMQARHLPTITHDGRTYAPYTGNVVAPYRGNVTKEKPIGFYMEYRALRHD